MSDNENEPKAATVMSPCDTCAKPTPHRTIGRKTDDQGRHLQTMECAICKTTTTVFMSEDGSDFQENLDTPSDSEG